MAKINWDYPGSKTGYDEFGRRIEATPQGGLFLVGPGGERAFWTQPAPGPTPVPAIGIPNVGATDIKPLSPTPPITFDPLLSPENILKQGQAAIDAAKAPVDPSKFIVPGARELLTQNINEQLNINRAAAQSDFAARGMTGSSTEVQTLTRDLPAAADKALAEGTIKLLTAAYPLALQDKQTIVDSTFKSVSLSTQLRSVIGDEQFKKLSLDQQRELANQDVQLKLKLADIEMKFQASMKQAEMAFTAAENEKDREVARQQFEYLKAERNKARTSSFMSSITSVLGMGIGAALAAPTGGMSILAGAALGGAAGGAAGGGFSNLFMLD